MLDSNEGQERTKETISRYLRHRFMTKRMHETEPDPDNPEVVVPTDEALQARRYWATQALFTGASHDDGDSADMKDLKTRNTYFFRHNHAFDIFSDWLKGSGFRNPKTGGTMGITLGQETDGHKMKLILDGDPGLFIYLSNAGASQRSGGVVARRSTRFSSHISTDLMKLLSTASSRSAPSPVQQSADMHDPINNVIEEYLENQRDILFKIFEAR